MSIPIQNEGSVVAGTYLNDNFYVIGNLNDANGDFQRASFDTFFDEREYFYAAEIGWVSSFADRYLNKINMLVWHQDERKEAQVGSSKGLSFTFSKSIGKRSLVFVRPGFSSGEAPLYNGLVSVGGSYIEIWCWSGDRKDSRPHHYGCALRILLNDSGTANVCTWPILLKNAVERSFRP